MQLLDEVDQGRWKSYKPFLKAEATLAVPWAAVGV